MSLFRRKGLYVALCPGRVGVVLVTGWTRGKNRRTAVLDVERKTDCLGFRPSLDSLSKWLDSADIRGAAMHVTVADDFARYSTMPWSADIKRRVDQDSLARVCIASAYGQRIEGWDIRFDYFLPRKPGLICAIERDFIQALLELSARHQLNLKSLQPAFIRAVNGWRAQISGSEGLVIVASDSTWVCGAQKDNAWTHVGLQRISSPLNVDTLSKMVKREMVLHGLPNSSTVTLFCHTPNLRVVAANATDAKLLMLGDSAEKNSKNQDEYPLGLALCANL